MFRLSIFSFILIAELCILNTADRTLTVWMKSQLHDTCRGLTVYESGKIVYRIDNYQTKPSNRALLMNGDGQEVFTIIRKRYVLGLGQTSWEGYKGLESSDSIRSKKASFQVKEVSNNIFVTRPTTTCEARYDGDRYSLKPCRIKKSHKLEFNITNADGKTIAEMKQKNGREGVALDRNVLSLKVGPVADVSMVVAFVTVFGLINGEL